MTILRLTSILATLLLALCALAEDEVHEQYLKVSDFDGVIVEIPITVHVTQGTKSVRITGDAEQLRAIHTTVVDGKLLVRGNTLLPASSEKVQLTISIPTLNSVKTTNMASVDVSGTAMNFFVDARGGSSIFVSNLVAKEVEVDVSDYSLVSLEGRADRLYLRARVNSQMIGQDLNLKLLTAFVEIGSQLVATPSDGLNLTMDGNSALFIDKMPGACTLHADYLGMSTILRCGNHPSREPNIREKYHVKDSYMSKPVQNLESPANKQECLDACEKGGLMLENFCRQLRTPRRRNLCWAATKGSKAACISMCHAIYK